MAVHLSRSRRMGLRLIGLLTGTAAVLAIGVGGATAQQVLKAGAVPFGGAISQLNTETGEFEGIVIDVLTAIAADNGFEIEFVNYLFAGLIPALDAGEIDLIAGTMGVNAERAEGRAYSTPLYAIGEALLVRADDDTQYTSLNDIAGQPLAMQTGNSYVARAQETGLVEITTFESVPATLAEVEAGRFDYAMLNNAAAAYQLGLGGFPNVQMVRSYHQSFVNNGAFLLPAASVDLLDQINASIAEMEADGTLAEIFARHGFAYVHLE